MTKNARQTGGGGSDADGAKPAAGKRERAYTAAAAIAREQMRREAPERARTLDEIEKSDVVVVTGQYDHVQSVLKALTVEHTVIRPHELDRLTLRPEQLLVVNCPGQVSSRAITRNRALVEAGGSLFSTDWALRYVIEAALPGVLAYNERPTADDVVRIEVKDPDSLYLQGVMDGQDDPQWWLEGSSYPIRILDAERVQVLITSRELEEKWGEAPVAVWFRWGEGEVFHMISHYYLQRTKLRTQRHQASAASYFAEKGVVMNAMMSDAVAGLCLAEVESAKPLAAFMANVVGEKKRRAREQAGTGGGPTEKEE